jgi:hypothetical protein
MGSPAAGATPRAADGDTGAKPAPPRSGVRAESPVPPAPTGGPQADPAAPRDGADRARAERQRGGARVRPEGARAEEQGPRPWSGGPPFNEEMRERVLAVARDVSPELAEQIARTFENASTEEAAQAMRQNARRLIGLAVLRERNRDLYETRVQDVRLQMELHTLGAQYTAATEAGNAAEAARLEREIATKARRQLEFDLKARGQELKALADQLDAMRAELRSESEGFEARVKEQIEAVKAGKPLRPRPFGGDGPRGAGGSGRGGDDGPRGDAPARPAAGAPDSRTVPAPSGPDGGRPAPPPGRN